MLWWASSIVFCGYVLAAVWSNREQLSKERIFVIGLGIVLFAFFSVISHFGFLVAYRLGIVQREIAVFASKLKYADLAAMLEAARFETKGGFFSTEIFTFQTSMMIGAGSFALIHVVWIVFWLYLMGVQRIWIYYIVGCIGVVFWIWRLLRWKRREKEEADLLDQFIQNQHLEQIEMVKPPPNKSFEPTAS
jgi:hypothetical protein